MVRTTLAVLSLVIAAGAAAPHADERSDARAQVDFGIEVARRGLWKEAVFRWERAIDLDPTYAEAWNNLAIGFEQQGLMHERRTRPLSTSLRTTWPSSRTTIFSWK